MHLGMNVDAFADDNGLQILNRSANEIVFTAIGSAGTLFKPVVRARVLAPAARDLAVQTVVADGEAFHAANEFTGSALATVRRDEDLAAVPPAGNAHRVRLP